MGMDKLRAMQTFVRIVDEGSLTAAAQALNTSLPSVVRTLASLESHLQARLLQRTTRRLSLTDEGRRYLEHCRAILGEIDDIEASLADQDQEPRGTITITAPVLLGQMVVAPAVRYFVQRHPQVRCNLLLLDRVVNLVEEQVDVAVRIDHLADSCLVGHSISTIRRVVVASPAFLRRYGTPRHPKDLQQANCVMAGRPWLFREGTREFTLQVSGNLDFNIGAPAIDACVEGLGFGMFLSYQVAPQVRRRQLRIVLEDYERAPMPLSIVYPHARLLPRRTRVFIEWMKSELKARL